MICVGSRRSGSCRGPGLRSEDSWWEGIVLGGSPPTPHILHPIAPLPPTEWHTNPSMPLEWAHPSGPDGAFSCKQDDGMAVQISGAPGAFLTPGLPRPRNLTRLAYQMLLWGGGGVLLCTEYCIMIAAPYPSFPLGSEASSLCPTQRMTGKIFLHGFIQPSAISNNVLSQSKISHLMAPDCLNQDAAVQVPPSLLPHPESLILISLTHFLCKVN